ncbi:hypothetical protein B9479_006258 [Cryptococcus floricola]|uniref:Uncharacterized protein n=1 Tax=Cryptococcus floricola TaxID=2591691 RepID=A0A5D3ANX7_9TREE|nr:hypothetical protein B9479_006258 [Cryptococcus floricola]
MTHNDSPSPSLGSFGSPQEDDVISLGSSKSCSSSASAETADPAIPNLSPFEEAYSGAKRYHCEDTDGHITRVSQLEATLANLSNLHEQEVRRNQEFTDGLVNRVSQLETTLANLTLQKTPPDIHVNVHMPPQQSSSTTAGDAPPRRSPHDEESSDAF